MEKQKNVVDISRWKDQKIKSEQEESIRSYFKSMNASDLVLEAKVLIDHIKRGNLDQGLVLHAKIVLGELKKRIKGQTPDYVNDLATLENFSFPPKG